MANYKGSITLYVDPPRKFRYSVNFPFPSNLRICQYYACCRQRLKPRESQQSNSRHSRNWDRGNFCNQVSLTPFVGGKRTAEPSGDETRLYQVCGSCKDEDRSQLLLVHTALCTGVYTAVCTALCTAVCIIRCALRCALVYALRRTLLCTMQQVQTTSPTWTACTSLTPLYHWLNTDARIVFVLLYGYRENIPLTYFKI